MVVTFPRGAAPRGAVLRVPVSWQRVPTASRGFRLLLPPEQIRAPQGAEPRCRFWSPQEGLGLGAPLPKAAPAPLPPPRSPQAGGT